MQEKPEKKTLSGAKLSESDKFYLSWGYESQKNNIKIVNDVLRQLITLNSAMIAGSIALLKSNLIGEQYTKAIILLFFVSLVTSFWGVFPFEGSFDIRRIDQIRKHKKRALKVKVTYMTVSGVLMVTGFAIAIFSVIMY